MKFLFFLIALLIFLLLYTIFSSLIRFSLYLTTRYSFEEKRLFFPTMFTMLLWCCIAIVLFYLLICVWNIPVIDIALNILIGAEVDANDILILTACLLTSFVFGVIVQSLTYFSANINISKITSSIRYQIKKITSKLKKEQSNDGLNEINDTINSNDNVQTSIALEEKQEKLDYSGAFAASLFTTCLIAFAICIFFLIGYVISGEFLSSL
ncbi:unknown [Clostridium sp. CAG:921]|nr:unknown [Clostridium sp. CAG:921]